MGTDFGAPTPPVEPPVGGEGVGGVTAPAPPAVPVDAPPPPAGPAAPVVGAPAGAPAQQYDQQQVEQAMGLHRALNDPIGQAEAMTRLVQRHGQLPDWFTWDHAVDAMRNYAQFISEMGTEEEPQVAPGGMGTATGSPPQQDFERAVQQYVQPLQQELQQMRQERMQDEGTRRAEMISQAVDSVGAGLEDAARETLLNNVVYGLRAAMDQGRQVDFSPRAINQYTNDMLIHLRSLALTQQQEQIAEHRGIAPQTRTPNGSPTGAPVARGLAGSAARAMDLARQWEAGQPR